MSRYRGMSRYLVVVAAVLLLSGCAAPAVDPVVDPAVDSAADSDIGDAAAAGRGGAVGLVNLWRVTGAESAGDHAFLRLEAGELVAWTDCGIATGSWRASDTAFLAEVSGAIGGEECIRTAPSASAPAASLAWLYAARGFRTSDDATSAELLGADGDVVAVLTIDGAPPASSDHSDDYLVPPEITPEIESALAEPAPLPAAVRPAVMDDLLGRWAPDNAEYSGDAFLQFASDGMWSSSDGCNHTVGRFAVADDGRLLATSGMTTLIGCDNWPGATWPWSNGRVGVVDGGLAFVDVDGTMLGAAVRS